MLKIFSLFLPMFLFSYEISFTKSFSKDLIPDVLSGNFSISIDEDEEKKVIERLKVFDVEIKSYNKVEKKLGRFNVRPVYQHSSHTPYIKGYKGTLSYQVNTNDALFMGEFVTRITALKDNRDTSLSLSNLSWTVKADTFNVTMDILRLEAITWAENHVKVLSMDLNKKCSIKKINFNEYIRPTLGMSRLSSVNNESTKVIVPEISEERITLNANFVMDCQ